MVSEEVDVLIVGGGLTGATLLLALVNSGYQTLLVETKPFCERISVDFDARSLALSSASVKILCLLDLWPLLQNHATAIETIHVSEQHAFGRARIENSDKSPLGYVLEMQHINRALHHKLPQDSVLSPAELINLDESKGLATMMTEDGEVTVKARLIVGADGAESTVRRCCGLSAQMKDYGQHAIVANVGLVRAHQQQAYERFTSSGPLAMLPMRDQRASLVWALPPAEARRLTACSDVSFLSELQQAFGYRLGRLAKVGKRVVFPLKKVYMPNQVKGHVVFVGNAAHTLHPVAGQGFNLGLRDVATLAQCLVQEGLSSTLLEVYQKARHHDQMIITCFTDALIALYTQRWPGLSCLRSAGLLFLDNTQPLKNVLKRYTQGFGGIVSLASDISLVSGPC